MSHVRLPFTELTHPSQQAWYFSSIFLLKENKFVQCWKPPFYFFIIIYDIFNLGLFNIDIFSGLESWKVYLESQYSLL